MPSETDTRVAIVVCPCGRPLHYTNAKIKAMVDELIRERGVWIEVSVDSRRWLVSRHYIALHGLMAQDLLAGRVPGVTEVYGNPDDPEVLWI